MSIEKREFYTIKCDVCGIAVGCTRNDEGTGFQDEFEFIEFDEKREALDFIRNAKWQILKGKVRCKECVLKETFTAAATKKSIYLKTGCPICGEQYAKDRKNKTTCGDDNCKVLKSRMLKKMKKFSGLTPEEFYQKLVEVDNRRIFVCKRNGMYSYKTIFNLRKIADIILRETK